MKGEDEKITCGWTVATVVGKCGEVSNKLDPRNGRTRIFPKHIGNNRRDRDSPLENIKERKPTTSGCCSADVGGGCISIFCGNGRSKVSLSVVKPLSLPSGGINHPVVYDDKSNKSDGKVMVSGGEVDL